MRADPTGAVAYSEPGLDLAGGRYLGPLTLPTSTGQNGSLPVLVTLAFSNASRLASLLANLSDPSSPEYHHYLSAAEFDAEFGASPSVYGAVLSYIASFDVTGLTAYADRLTVAFQATPSEAAEIFGTPIGAFSTAAGLPYYAPLSAPQLPAPLVPYVLDVEGLSNYSGYLTDLAPLALAAASSVTVDGAAARASTDWSAAGAAAADPASSPLGPGGADNPFSNTTVTWDGLTNTYDQPVLLSLKGHSGQTCDSVTCGNLVEPSDLQVTYNETGLFDKYGYPVNATVAAILWSDTACRSDSGTCSSDGYYNYFCSTLGSGTDAWDFFMPDVTSFWNYTIPAGEPMPTAYSMAELSYDYAYPSKSQGYSASCDDGGAELENTLDVDMLGSLAPGANVFQVFGGSSDDTALDAAFADILSPATTDFDTAGGFDTSVAIAKLGNVSVISNSWSSSASLPAAWNSDLEIAAARGITVLGATGDSGTVLAPPAETADNTYGVVAVSGTTAAINLTTLLRGPPHLAVSTAPYYGVGTGEIGWYEPAGTVAGFGSTFGGTGGVATSTAYYRATWFNASADAVSVADAVSSGDFRAEPDVAAIANDTMVDVDIGDESINMTCWVTTACTSTSPIAVGNTSGSSPLVGPSYVIGTSIATPVTGGLVATIDYALHTRGQGWLGYLDPALYALGQKQYAGHLTLHASYDVTAYTDAGGLTADYEAKAGYDLATGWGVLDAGNLTQDTMTYPTTFTETGLPGGIQWSVTVSPTVGDANCTVSGSACSNAASESSTGTSIVFAESFGSFTYTATCSDAEYTAPGGAFQLAGAPDSVTVAFGRSSYGVTFTESGLPTGTTWYLNVTAGGSYHALAGSPITFDQANGVWDYTLASSSSSWSAPGGSFTVSGENVSVQVTFAHVSYTVTFNETGLPPGLLWYVNLTGGTSLNTTGRSIVATLPNGSYGYSVAAENRSYDAAPGTFLVNGVDLSIPVTFGLVTYPVTFVESGLGSGLTWSVTFAGLPKQLTTNGLTDTLSFGNEPNGSYPYSIEGLSGWSQSTVPYAATVVVDGSARSVMAAYARVVYDVTFNETALPSGTTWYVNVSGEPSSKNPAGTAAAFEEPNGTFNYTLGSSNSSWAASRGNFTVNGGPLVEPATFALVTFSVTFLETGLPSGTEWRVNLTGGTSVSSTGPSLVATLPNATYHFTVTASRASYTSPAGTFDVHGRNLTEKIAFSSPPPAPFLSLPAGTEYPLLAVAVAVVVGVVLVAVRRRRRRPPAPTGPAAEWRAPPGAPPTP